MAARLLSQAERLASSRQGWQIGARRDGRPIAWVNRCSEGTARESVVNNCARDCGALGQLGVLIRQDVRQF